MNPMVNKPTVVESIRCPCSQNRLPTILGDNWPFESVRSEVAKPASLLVTSAPAMIKKNVAQATSIANRFKPRDIIHCRLPIADCRFVDVHVNNRQSAIAYRQCPQCFLPNIGNWI